ncbi:MAG: hypothetical protein GX163_04945 [Bacteroidetes bacterium]|nr:hypothetical protein [Bacteroidota bacterium]
MKKRIIINALLVTITAILFLSGYFLKNEFTQTLYIIGVPTGFWALMRIFKMKQIATKD